MDVFEGEDYPIRTAQQEEEQQASSSAFRNLQPPLILMWPRLRCYMNSLISRKWNRRLRQQLYPDGVMPTNMVMATSKVSCAMLNGSYPSKQVIGTCVLPEVPMAGNQVLPSLRDRTCLLYACGDAGQLLLVCCQYDVPPERATALARVVFSELCPKHVLVLGVVSSEQMRAGEADPSQEAVVFLLRTTAAKQAAGAQPPPVPYLPSGSVVAGLPAACLSYCQARGISAELLLSVDMVPSLAHMALQPMAQATAALLAHAGGGMEAPSLVLPSCLRRANAEIEAAYGGAFNGVGAVFA